MRQLTILKGEELRISIKDKIDANNLFIEEYREAARKLNEIIYSSEIANQQNKRVTSSGVNEYLYDVEDIYEWVDYIRKMGLEQVFHNYNQGNLKRS